MGSPLPPDPYVALGVAKDATPAVIKAAHRKLVLKCHPDKVTDPAAKQAASDLFHKIQSSYEILIDEDRRVRYDAQVRLAELKRETMERRSGEGSRGYEPRSGARPSKESYFKDSFYSRVPEGMTPQFEERRPDYAATTTSASATAAAFDEVPSRANTRKEPEVERVSRKTASDAKEKPKAAARESSRERQRAFREKEKQKSQKETHRNRDRKYSSYPGDESESNSDGYVSRRRARDEDQDHLRHARAEFFEQVDRQAKEAASDAPLDDRTRKMFSQHSKAWDHINHSSSRRSSTKAKTDEREPEPSRRRRERRSPERAERFEEVRRPPPLAKSTSSPLDIRIPGERSRAQSHDDTNMSAPKAPGIKRAETFQVYPSSRRTEPLIPPKFRPTDFTDGLPTPGLTPTVEVSPTSRFPYGKQYADDAEYPTPDGYRTSGDSSNIEVREPRRRDRQMPSFTRRVTRSPSPIMAERPRMTTTRYPSSAGSTRTTSYVYPGSGQGVEQLDRASRQNNGRSSSSRDVKGSLYGEITPPRQRTDPYQEVNYARPMRTESSKTYPYRVNERPTVVPRNSSTNPLPVR